MFYFLARARNSLLKNVRPTLKAASISSENRGVFLGCKVDGA
jgi:hypothetical protein